MSVTATEKLCPKCNKKLPAISYWKDKKSDDGLFSQCKDCFNKKRGTKGPRDENKALGTYPKLSKIPSEIAGAEISIDFLADFRKMRKNEWLLPQVKLLISKVNESIQRGIDSFDKVYAAYGSGHNRAGCTGVLAEIKKLAIYNRELKLNGKKEETLDEYWKAGRRFKIGNQIVASVKSNGKKSKK